MNLVIIIFLMPTYLAILRVLSDFSVNNVIFRIIAICYLKVNSSDFGDNHDI